MTNNLNIFFKEKTKNIRYEEIKCPICNSDDYEILLKKGEFNIKLNASICKNCGLVYLNPRWDKKSYDSFYRDDYDKLFRPVVLNVNDDILKSAKDIASSLCNLIEQNNISLNSVCTVLDVGCGMGWFLDYFKNKYNVSKLYAIEPSPHCIKNCNKFGIRMIAEDVDESWHNSYKGFFDFIMFRGVIEHLTDPLETLKKLSYVCSKKGIIYISTQDSWNPELPISKHFFKIVHTFYFTETSLKNLIYLSGMKPLFIGQEGGGCFYAICCNQ